MTVSKGVGVNVQFGCVLLHRIDDDIFAVDLGLDGDDGVCLLYTSQAQEGGGQEQGGAQNSAGAQRSGQQQKIYSAQETAVFSEGRMAALLSPEETFAFSLLEGNVYAGTFAADGKTYILALIHI